MTKPPKKGLDGILPPARPEAAAPAEMFAVPSDDVKVQFNVKVPRQVEVAYKTIGLKLNRKPAELLEEGIRLLEAKYGAV